MLFRSEILIDGQNIRNLTQQSLRAALGIVPQEPVLWNDTIGQNIGYGREGSTDEEIREAAKAARLDERIMGFPEGYKTVVGERGVRLSGGEKQRVSLARTILKAPSILVLDEATSALDTENERFVQQSLNDLAKGRTSLHIAHRLSTLHATDKIIVLGDGKVLEVGTHKELLNKPDGVFAAMWQAQIQTDTEEEDAGVDGQKVIDDKFDQIEAQADTAIKGAHPVNGQATRSDSRHKNQVSSPDESHADPFTVDIEKGAGSSNQAVRSEHVGVQNGNIPATLEDVSSPAILDEGDADEGEPLLAMPDKSSNKRNAAITSGSSKNVHVPSGSSDRSHSGAPKA